MSKIEIEKLLYRKPELNLGLNSLYKVHYGVGPAGDEGNETGITIEPSATETPNSLSNGTGAEGFVNP